MQYVAVRNQFRPTALVPHPYGWTGAPSYNRADVPSALVDKPPGITAEELQKILAYEWLDSSSLPGAGFANPPFTSGAAGRLHPLLRDESGQPARILRGFIRRAQYDAGDDASKARLYFMYNPEQITRQYVSYLDQQALDPFNTLYQSGNLVAPPSFMDFSFDLFFDRQTEATQTNHPGVFVDYQFFDLVVRNVVPRDPNSSTNNQLPDNGVMMINPRDITVVFSPQLTVQGRPYQASVTFEKFTHRMTPVRMRISLTMRVMYFGPMLEQTEYRMQQYTATSQATVGYTSPFSFNITYTDIVLPARVEATAYMDSSTDLATGPSTAFGEEVSNAAGINLHASGDPSTRGWGPGCGSTRLTTITTRGGIRVATNSLIADLVQRLLYESEAPRNRMPGYKIHSISSYSCRQVTGGGGRSFHSWALAEDINADKNPYGSTLVTDMPKWMVTLWNSHGFRWGGSYSTHKDAMHYEFMGTPADAKHQTSVAQKQHLGGI